MPSEPELYMPRNPPKKQTLVDPRTAMYTAIALQAADTDCDPKDALWCLGYNLGIRAIGTVGERVRYDCLIHEDTVGGLIPGCDDCTVTHQGWRHEDDGPVLVRARVHSTQGE